MPLYLQTAVFITQGELQKARDGGGNGGSIAVLWSCEQKSLLEASRVQVRFLISRCLTWPPTLVQASYTGRFGSKFCILLFLHFGKLNQNFLKKSMNLGCLVDFIWSHGCNFSGDVPTLTEASCVLGHREEGCFQKPRFPWLCKLTLRRSLVVLHPPPPPCVPHCFPCPPFLCQCQFFCCSAGQFRELIWPKSVKKEKKPQKKKTQPKKRRGLWEPCLDQCHPTWACTHGHGGEAVCRQAALWMGELLRGENDTPGENQGYFYIGLVTHSCSHLSISKKSWGPVQGQAWAVGEETLLRQHCLWRTCSSKHGFRPAWQVRASQP